jgi:hypothetical protein
MMPRMVSYRYPAITAPLSLPKCNNPIKNSVSNLSFIRCNRLNLTHSIDKIRDISVGIERIITSISNQDFDPFCGSFAVELSD